MTAQLKGCLDLLRQVRVELRVVSSDLMGILHKTCRKKEMNQFWRIPELMGHLKEDDLSFETSHSLLLLRNDSRRKISYYRHNKT